MHMDVFTYIGYKQILPSLMYRLCMLIIEKDCSHTQLILVCILNQSTVESLKERNMVELRITLGNNEGFMPCVERTMTSKNCR